MKNFQDRFWAKVRVGREDECWHWTGASNVLGYGSFKIRTHKTLGAHVVALSLASREDSNGRYALHRCDVPICCNPAHLYWGDQTQNMADMDSRGRANRGRLAKEAHPHAKLSNSQVLAIRQAYATGQVYQRELAEQYGVTQPHISDIVREKNWVGV